MPPFYTLNIDYETYRFLLLAILFLQLEENNTFTILGGSTPS